MNIQREDFLSEKKIRMEKIDKMMVSNNLDAVLFTSPAQQAYQVHVKYVAGVPLTTRRAFVFKELGKEPTFFLPMAGDRKTYPNKSWIETENLYLGNMLPTVIGLVEKLTQNKPRIGWATPSEIPHEIYSALTGTKAEFVDVTDDFTILRANKSEYEIALTKLASDLTVESFEDLIRQIKPGMTEWQLIGGAIGFLAQRGAEELLVLGQSKKPFATIHRPTDVTLGPTDIFVYSAEIAGPGGYWTQLIRPVFMDRAAHPDAYDIWKVALEAEQAAADAARPGNRVCDVHNAVDHIIRKHGMNMNYWAGHGMGADLGDGVDISPENTMEIVPNMALTLQPSVEGKENSLLYGNTFLTTETGDAINLTGKYMNSPYLDDLIREVGFADM